MNSTNVPRSIQNNKYIKNIYTFQIERTLHIDSCLFSFHLTYFGYHSFISGEVSLGNEGYKNDFWL